MKNIKNQKGAISLFVVLSMLFFLAFMLGAFSMVSRRNAAQLEAVRETAKIYDSGVDAGALYESMMATVDGSVIPISTPEQLKKLKDITEVNTTSTANYTINGKLYTYKKYNSTTNTPSYMLANDIVLDLTEEINGKKNITIYDYMLYDKTNYNINLNNHNIYYKLSDGSLWKCVFYHNIGTSTAKNLFASNTEAGKSYTTTKYSILANGLEQFKYPWTTTTNYEFLLTYNCSSTQTFDSTVYQRWRQEKNPTIETSTDTSAGTDVAGLETLSYGIGLDTHNYWGGLTLSTSSGTYLDGSVGHSNWFYAVGARSFHGTYGIPTSDKSNTSASECLLFIRAK